MAFKFFNIGKANEEIARLEAENAKLVADSAATNGNSAEVEAQAEKVSAELNQAKADLLTAKASVASLTTQNEKLVADLKAANEKIANPAEEVKILASRKALEIAQAQGIPPIAGASGSPASGDVLAQYAAIKDSTAKTVFYRANKAAYDAAHKAHVAANPKD